MPNVAKPNSIPTVRKINIKYNWREEWKSLFGRNCSVSLTMKKSYLREDYWIFFLHLDDNWSSAIDNLARQNSPDEEKKITWFRMLFSSSNICTLVREAFHQSSQAWTLFGPPLRLQQSSCNIWVTPLFVWVVTKMEWCTCLLRHI